MPAGLAGCLVLDLLEIHQLRSCAHGWSDSLPARIAILEHVGLRFGPLLRTSSGWEAWQLLTDSLIDVKGHQQRKDVQVAFIKKTLGIISVLWGIMVAAYCLLSPYKSRTCANVMSHGLALDFVMGLVPLATLQVAQKADRWGHRSWFSAMALQAMIQGFTAALVPGAFPQNPKMLGVYAFTAGVAICKKCHPIFSRSNPDQSSLLIYTTWDTTYKSLSAVNLTSFVLSQFTWSYHSIVLIGGLLSVALVLHMSTNSDRRKSNVEAQADVDHGDLVCQVSSNPFGVQVAASRYNLPKVMHVAPDSHAEKMGVRQGDILVGINGIPLTFATWSWSLRRSRFPLLRFRRPEAHVTRR